MILLQIQDLHKFASAFFSVLQAKETVILTANTQPKFLEEICDSQTTCLTDSSYASDSLPKDLSIDPNAQIILYTSGTSGKPKSVHKCFRELDAECKVLEELFGEQCKNTLFCRTVSHCHIYGLLLSVLLPVRLGCCFRRDVELPDSLNSLHGDKITLISSPAFLKRIKNKTHLDIASVFCSGGVLQKEDAENAYRMLGSWPIEIYGSTETGGIAHRQSRDGLEWQPFSVCKLSIAGNACLKVESPYIADPNGFVTGDLAEFLSNGNFLLKGRADSVVKIEEKRISLAEVENRIMESGLAQEACVVAIEIGSRQCLGAAIALNELGKSTFKEFSVSQKNNYFRSFLANFLEGVTIPKRWRYLEALPQNSQGKIKPSEIKSLFTGARKAVANFSVPTDSDYFNGHFEKFPLLPAVVQVDMAIRQAALHFDTPLCLNRILKVKFMKPILPEAPLKLELAYTDSENKLSFDFFNAKDGSHYSSGTIFLDAGK